MMFDAKNVLIVFLSSFCGLLLVTTIYFYGSANTVTKTETVKVPVVYDIENVRKWMLRVGVSGAWVENVGNRKADCFVTTMFSNGAALSYCELRR